MSESIDSLSCLCEKKAHGVIGQEFDKVVFAIDYNFRYAENNRLTVRQIYYSLRACLKISVCRKIRTYSLEKFRSSLFKGLRIFKAVP